MRSASFDTLTYARKLQQAGFTPQQAEAQAEALHAVVEENLATKHDIELLRRDIEQVRRELGRDIELVRKDIIIWLGSVVVIATTVLGFLIKVL